MMGICDVSDKIKARESLVGDLAKEIDALHECVSRWDLKENPVVEKTCQSALKIIEKMSSGMMVQWLNPTKMAPIFQKNSTMTVLVEKNAVLITEYTSKDYELLVQFYLTSLNLEKMEKFLRRLKRDWCPKYLKQDVLHIFAWQYVANLPED